ncbi:unnamed protein product [Darwinula stevensoni]|uniref:Large ribosomal subunit protein mL62 n=1 Tax=Darwinula stevensoni TaxID=69355 RepID=A0A7R9ABH9_9CRUS|nr:unnamed protein product [Darwinula stevensoni]CAG0899299.1 unnamed protein product [Darwinula stevensoni]
MWFVSESLSITYSRSSGPGGQHVNKTCSKVDVRFHLANAEWLSDYMKSKLQEKKPNHLNKDGYFVVKSEKTKSQQLNVADCLDKLRSMIRDAIKEPVGPNPLTLERRRRLLEQHARARLREKRAHSLIKQLRQSPSCA